MSDRLGPITYGSSHDEVFLGRDYTTMRNYSEKVASEIDDEVRSTIDEAYRKCEEILTNNLDKLHLVAEYLLKHETMDGEVFNSIMDGVDIAEIEANEEKKAAEKAEEDRQRRIADEARRAEEEAKRRQAPPWIPPDDPSYEEYKKQNQDDKNDKVNH